jgi:hypothetical protein
MNTDRIIDARHAKKLQSEVEYLKSQLTQTQGCVTISRNGYVQELERERDEAREQRDKAREIYQKSYTAELARANHYKQQRDRLAEALREIRKGITEPTHHRRGTLEIANEALAAVKGGEQ